MEEWVGQLWHRWVVRAASREFPDQSVSLETMKQPAGMVFRALGGDPGLELKPAALEYHGGHRHWLQRLAGTGQRQALAGVDGQALYLPGQMAHFPRRAWNARLYLWLAALAACHTARGDWLEDNLAAVRLVLRRLPGMRPLWDELLWAHLELRGDPGSLPPQVAVNELRLRRALQAVAVCEPLLPDRPQPAPVPLLLYPVAGLARGPARKLHNDDAAEGGESRALNNRRRHRGRRVEEPDERGGLLAFRLESLFTRAEYVGVDRAQEEDEDEKQQDALDDMDEVSVSAASGATRQRVRFDLDLPPEEMDDTILRQGLLLPEWDHRKQALRDGFCRVLEMEARQVVAQDLPPALRGQARRIRQQFEQLMPQRIWQRRCLEGAELDVEAWLQYQTERLRGQVPAEWPVFRDFRQRQRDLSCLLLADLSLSTDAAADGQRRVIDVIRESLHLFAEALAATRDDFAIYGFSSRRREHVRLHRIKEFNERHGPEVRGRIEAMRPGYYTRMGAAIRYAARQLAGRPARQKLLLLLTDGKPNDLDHYEGRYGLEDTRHALQECREQGIRPFCVSIDREQAEYLPWLMGAGQFVHIHRVAELSHKLPLLYARLTA